MPSGQRLLPRCLPRQRGGEVTRELPDTAFVLEDLYDARNALVHAAEANGDLKAAGQPVAWLDEMARWSQYARIRSANWAC